MKRKRIIVILIFLILIFILIACGGYFYNRFLSLEKKEVKESSGFPRAGEIVCQIPSTENIVNNEMTIKYDNNVVNGTESKMDVIGSEEVLDTYEELFEFRTVLTLAVKGINLNVKRDETMVHYNLKVDYSNFDYDKLLENAEAQETDDARTSLDFVINPNESSNLNLNNVLEHLEIDKSQCKEI